MNKDASMTAAHLYLTDHKAQTINRVIDAAKEFRRTNHLDNVTVRLAAGNAAHRSKSSSKSRRSFAVCKRPARTPEGAPASGRGQRRR